MRRRRLAVAFVAALLVSMLLSAALAAAGPPDRPDTAITPGVSESSISQVERGLSEVAHQKLVLTPAQKKVDTNILSTVRQAQAHMFGMPAEQVARLEQLSTSLVKIDDRGRVAVKLSVPGMSAEQRGELESQGLKVTVSLPDYGIIEGTVPWNRVEAIAALGFVRNVSAPGYAVPNVGVVTSAGDTVLRAAEARAAFAVDGSGVGVGVISDGVSHLSDSQASGDLPSVNVLKAGSGDEGTAMLEIVHDLAPGSTLGFYGPNTSSDMVAGIAALEDAGCDVVVDDLIFLDEPKFEDGPIALEARAFVQAGGVYATSAGNSAGRHYRHPYQRYGTKVAGAYAWHDHDESVSVDLGNTFIVPDGGTLIAVLQWNNEWGSSADDFDLWLEGASSDLAASWDTQDGNDDPWEALSWTNETGSSATVFLAVGEWSLVSDPSSLLLDCTVYTDWGTPGLQYIMPENSVVGHEAVEEVLSTAAAWVSTPTVIESYSSRGPGTVYFPSLQDRQVPNITGVDGVETRTGQLGWFSANPFSGTSAAAPHVAAIAALVWDANPSLTSSEVFDAITSTAVDLATPGWDATSGYGRADAYDAVDSVLDIVEPPTIGGLSPTSGPTSGGTSVVITGTGFTGIGGPGIDPDAVTFGGTNATTYAVDSPTQITATAPAHGAGPVQVQVTAAAGSTGDTAADDYTYVAAPEGPLAIHERVSVSSEEAQGDYHSRSPSVSADGRYVAFVSAATNLVPGDTNELLDIFVRDRSTGITERVSVASDSTEADDDSITASISGDGRYVGFVSYATDLVPGDTNAMGDVFVHDRQTGITERVNVSSEEAQGNNPGASTYVPCVSLSADGRFVCFSSNSSNLVAGDTNNQWDIFVRDRQQGTTERVSVSSAGAQAGSTSDAAMISADGWFVAFDSAATNLVDGDVNGNWDVFVHNRHDHTTMLESRTYAGGLGNDMSGYPVISGDGRYVAFESYARNLVTGDSNWVIDVFVRDRTLQTTQRVSVSGTGAQGYGDSDLASISADGRLVAFESFAPSLVPGDTNANWDLFVRDRVIGTTQRVSLSGACVQGNNKSWQPALSADGRYVAFGSTATNLVSGDTNGVDDIFVMYLRSYSSIRGSHRYHTAQLISQAMFPGPLPAGSGLVIAPGETFPEALCGAPLAAAWGGPVLLTPPNGLENGTRAEILRLAPAQVFCIGLSDTVVNAVRATVGQAVTVTSIRGDGGGVYDMSYRVAKALGTKVGDISGATAIVTIGTNFPDALGVSPLACARLWPILLTESPGGAALNAKAALALSELGITKTIKLGTYVTLPPGVTYLANLSGTDRYVTNANVANWAKENGGLSFMHTGLATGDKFPDALAAGPYLAKDAGLLLLTPLTGPLPANISALMAGNRAEVQRFSFIAMIEPVRGQVKAQLP